MFVYLVKLINMKAVYTAKDFTVGEFVKVKIGKFRGKEYQIIAISEYGVSFNKVDNLFIWVDFKDIKKLS
jgi:hypothetical protein